MASSAKVSLEDGGWYILTSTKGLMITGVSSLLTKMASDKTASFSSKYCSQEAMSLLAPSSVSEGKRLNVKPRFGGLADFFRGGALGGAMSSGFGTGWASISGTVVSCQSFSLRFPPPGGGAVPIPNSSELEAPEGALVLSLLMVLW